MKTIRRRRLEGKTDYKARLALLKSERPRLVVRKTNRYIIAQIVETENAQDKVIIGVTSKDLLSKGWPENQKGSLKNLQACYLTGHLIAKHAVKKGIKEIVFDMGMHRNVHKSRLYAFLKGAVDTGIKVPYSGEALPSDSDLQKNEKFKNMISRIKEKI